MAYVVTARKWRPQKFSEVVGQDHITNTLINAIKNNRIAHAYLFTGPRGVGKTTTARILAKRLNCISPIESEPCNDCENCNAVQKNQFLDIIEIDGASNRGIEEIRSLRESVKYAPTKGKYKVYIIDEVHMLTKESFNAFLKTLEEPPEHSIFIFATTEIQKVPLTIISRCQRFDFRRIELKAIKDLLFKISKSEGVEIDDDTVTTIAKKADGALRDAESYFDQVVSYCGKNIDKVSVTKMLNLISDEIYFEFSNALLNKDFKEVFKISDTIYKNGWIFIDFYSGLTEHFRNILTVIATGTTDLIETSETNKTKYIEYENRFSEGDLLRILNFLNKSFQELRFSQNQKLKVEISLTHLIGLEKSSTISEIIARIEDNNFSEVQKRNISLTNETEKVEVKKKSPLKITEPLNNSILSNKKEEYKSNISIGDSQYKSITIDFEFISTKWDDFVNIIFKEKSLLLGPILQNVKLENFESNKLLISFSDSESKFQLESHKEYLEKKSFDYFGRKINFVFTQSTEVEEPKKDTIENKIEQNSTPNQKNLKEISTSENSPLAKKIIAELGGQEIK